MAEILEVSIFTLWLDHKIEKVDELIDGMTLTEIREFQQILFGLIDHLAERER